MELELQQRKPPPAKAQTKKRKRPLSLGPKKSGGIKGCGVSKTKLKKSKKNTKNKGKKEKSLIGRDEIECKNDGEIQKIENKKKKDLMLQQPTTSQQLRYFLHQYQSANGIQLSALELESFKDAIMLEIRHDTAQNINSLNEHIKVAFGSTWKEVLCGKDLIKGKVDPGNPAVLVITLSALRSLELLRELRPLTEKCHALKLFSKHMKIEEQVSLLKNRVNIACGTPSRIKKLIDMDALGLSRLAVIVLDMYTDVKGYSLLTLPQVRGEFWDLYKCCFHKRLVEGSMRICLYGSISEIPEAK